MTSPANKPRYAFASLDALTNLQYDRHITHRDLNMRKVQPSRRFVLRTAVAALGAAALYWMNKLAKRAEETPEAAENAITLPYASIPGVRFYDEAIVVTSDQGVSAFSSVCPHLGCRINRVEAGEIVCPCHGSRFAMDGAVAHGPASRRLQPLRFEIDRSAGNIRIYLKSR